MATTADELREQVRLRYAESARSVSSGSEGCGSGACCDEGDPTGTKFGEALYSADQRGDLPDAAVLASLGCGNPTAVADLHEGETVLDLGSGGGIDVILSAKRVGPTGTAFGLDMTDEMLALARKNASDANVTNVHFLKGYIESIPLPADSVDVVISNCVINLSTDKAAVLTEIGRVLKPGGRIGISDVVAEDQLTPRSAPNAAATSAASQEPSRKASTSPGSTLRASKTSPSTSRIKSPTGCTAPSSRRPSRDGPVGAAEGAGFIEPPVDRPRPSPTRAMP